MTPAASTPWLPDLCRLTRLAIMFGVAEMVVLVIALAPDGGAAWDTGRFVSASGFALWLALTVSVLLCLARKPLSRLPRPIGGGLALLLAASSARAEEGYGLEDVSLNGWLFTGLAVIGAFIASKIRPWAAFLVYFIPLITGYGLYHDYQVHAAVAVQDLPSEFVGDTTGPFVDQAIRFAVEVSAPILAFFVAKSSE